MTRAQRYRERSRRHGLFAALAAIALIHLIMLLIHCVQSAKGGSWVMGTIAAGCLCALIAWLEAREALRLSRIADGEERWTFRNV